MLNNFIYAKTKDLFIDALEAGNVLDEAIVFIEDTKEIWNHGTYFSTSFADNIILNDSSLLEGDITDDDTIASVIGKIRKKLLNIEDALLERNVGSEESDDELSNIDILEALANKQDTLVSGVNIKTINNQSLLGKGNITINSAPTKVSAFINDANYQSADQVQQLIDNAITLALNTAV